MLYSCHNVRPIRGARRARSAHLVVDVHCHAFCPEAAALMRPHVRPEFEPAALFANEATQRVNADLQPRLQEKFSSPAARLADMDAAGIDVQVVSPAPPQYYYWADPDLAAAASRLINDNIAELVANAPERFVGMGHIPMQVPELAVRELRRLVTDLGFRGVQINTNVAGLELSDPRFRPVLAAAEELEAVLFLHPTGFTEGSRLAEHFLINLIGAPLDTTIALHHLIFSGALESLPNLKILAAHGGGFAGAYIGRMDHGHAHRPDCRTCISRPPSEFLRRIHFDAVVYDRQELTSLVARHGADRVLLGTDWPYDMALPDPVPFVEGLGLPAADAAALLGGNACRLLNLSPESHGKGDHDRLGTLAQHDR